MPQVEVTFDIDANGIVHVSAKDLGTGREQSIKITASSGLSEEEIKKMVRDAEAHAEEDKRKKELAEARNEADTLIYSIEKSLTDYGDKVSEGERADIASAIEEAKKAKDGEDVAAIKDTMQKLSTVSHKLAEEIYKKAGAGAAGEGGGRLDLKAALAAANRPERKAAARK